MAKKRVEPESEPVQVEAELEVQPADAVPMDNYAVDSLRVDLEAPLEQFICPACGKSTHYRCNLCGATRTTNQVSGNVIWMRNGRVLEAFQDSLQAWIRMATRFELPREEWPIQFRDAHTPPIDPFEE